MICRWLWTYYDKNPGHQDKHVTIYIPQYLETFVTKQKPPLQGAVQRKVIFALKHLYSVQGRKRILMYGQEYPETKTTSELTLLFHTSSPPQVSSITWLTCSAGKEGNNHAAEQHPTEATKFLGGKKLLSSE